MRFYPFIFIGNDDELQRKADKLFKQSLDQVNHRVLDENDLDCIMHNEFAREEFGYWIDDIPYQMKADVKCDHSQLKDMVHSMLVDLNNGQEKEVYFYHSDHLGSASWITDSIGIPIQHLQYLRFTGKERDEETGYGYFGARYMDHELMTMWLSVDPMADKYPSISPYAYCAWNPVKLVDPDGREIWIGSYNGEKSRYIPNKKGNTGVAVALDMIYKSKAGKFVINSLIKSKNRYCVSEVANPSGNENPGYIDANNQIYLNVKKHKLNVLSLSHELFHAFQDEKGVHGKLRSKEVEAFIFSGIVLSQLNNGRDVFSLKEAMPSGMDKAYTALDSTSKKGKEYVLAMGSLTKGFSTAQMGIAVSRFLNFSMEGDGYRNERGYKYCGGDGVGYRPSTSLLNKYSKDLY